jgi:dihydrofolate reductase
MIKAFIIAAMSADGFIAKDPKAPSTTWTSKDDKKRFVEISKHAGVCVMGLNTWQTFGGRPLKDRLNIVYSPTPIPNLPAGVEVTSKPPAELIADLESRGFKEVAICGGSTIYTMFMKAGVVSTLYLTVEPVLFGDGIRLFREPLDFRLKLIETSHTDAGTQLLTYEIDNAPRVS